jgi:phage portal protein BeeE
MTTARRWMRGLRGGKATTGGATQAHFVPGIRSLPPKRGTAEFLRAYNEMPWLRAATAKVASSLAAVEWQVYDQRDGQRRALPDHPLKRLLDAGTGRRDDGVPGLTGLDVRKLTNLHLDLAGEAFWVLERNLAGVPVALLPVPPHWVRDLARPGRPVYGFSVPGGFQGELPANEVVMFREVDPLRPYERGSGLAQALADELDSDEYAAKYVGAFLANRARPDLIVAGTQEQPLSHEEALRLEEAWSNKFAGPARSGRPFFSSGPLSVTEIGQSFRDNQMTEIRAFERDTIVSVFGLPPEKLGILQNSNRSTIEAADLFFAKAVRLPRLRLLREVVQQHLVPEFDERLVVDFANPVEEDREFTRRVMLGAKEHFTRNELRALARHGARPDGDELPAVSDEGQGDDPPAPRQADPDASDERGTADA